MYIKECYPNCSKLLCRATGSVPMENGAIYQPKDPAPLALLQAYFRASRYCYGNDYWWFLAPSRCTRDDSNRTTGYLLV
ncbi:hypothetical protein AYI68_g3272 [Smittium mucronatum]|uniref:Uncharacterized protein n=1 Tax=Smittium mucronatum TaxID=133383 RepID=A0A1R0H0E8_9FUNG|nr:hypothetical protein AYI68_g3272 [Smittium mucronatum]